MLLIANEKLTTQIAITSRLFVNNKLMLTCCHLFAIVRIIIHVNAIR